MPPRRGRNGRSHHPQIDLTAERVTRGISEPYDGQGLNPQLTQFWKQTTSTNRVAFLTGSSLLQPLAWATTALGIYAIWDYYRVAPAAERRVGGAER